MDQNLPSLIFLEQPPNLKPKASRWLSQNLSSVCPNKRLDGSMWVPPQNLQAGPFVDHEFGHCNLDPWSLVASS